MQNDRKEFLCDCARYIRGEVEEIRLHGKKKDVLLFADTLRESRGLFQCLNEKEPHVSKVLTALTKKRTASRKLKKATGFSWPF